MISLEGYKKAFASLPEGAKEAEVNAETHRVTELLIEEDRAADVQVSSSAEFFIRVSGEKTGYLYTQDPGEDPAQALQKAFENSFYSDRTGPEQMNREALVCERNSGGASGDIKTLAETAISLNRRVRECLASGHGLSPELCLSFKAEAYGQHTVNSHGLDVCAENALYIAGFQASAGRESIHFDQVKNAPDAFDAEEIAGLIAERLRALDGPAEDFASGEYEVILSEYAVSQMMMTAWQEFSALKYADNACALAGLLGERIAGEALTIVDVPLPPEGGYPAFADAEGTPGVPVKLVDKGIFTGLMTNQGSAAALGLPATGNAGRRPLLFGNIATDILVTPKNFCIEPGQADLREMEEHMGDGIVITEYFDLFHSLDIASGSFSVPCYGVLVKNGRESGCVRALTLSGNFRKMLSQVTEVGSRRVIHPMEFLQNYGIGSCALRVGKLSVSGE